MTRTQLQNELCSKTGLSKDKIRLFLDSFIDLLVQKAKSQEDVLISRLGSFRNRKRAGRKFKSFTNPSVIINVPEKTAFKFFSSPTLRHVISNIIKNKQGLEINITKNTTQKEPETQINEKPLKINISPSLVKSVIDQDEANSDSHHIVFKYIPEQVLKTIPAYLAKTYKIVPIELEGNVLKAAVCDQTSSAAIDFLKNKTGLSVIPVQVSLSELTKLINRYGVTGAHPHGSFDENEVSSQIFKDSLFTALTKKAKQLIIEPKQLDAHILVRKPYPQLLYSINLNQYKQLVKRIKDLALLDSNIENMIQKNEIQYNFQNQKIKLDITCLPTINGEKITIEIDDLNDFEFTLDNIGLLRPEAETIRKQMLSRGMILISGLPKSGKTTLAYAIAKEMAEKGLFIASYEDSVKKIIPNTTQTEFDPKIGYWNWIENVMKLNPDAILIRNINHPEAAKAAFHAAGMGHLIIATINAVNIVGLLQKLSNFNIDNHLILNGLSVLVYKKLLPALCPDCSKEVQINSSGAKATNQKILKIPTAFKQEIPRSAKFYEKGRCFFCNYETNFEPIYEVFPLDDGKRKNIYSKISRNLILKTFRQHELITLKQHALIKALQGKITYQNYKEV